VAGLHQALLLAGLALLVTAGVIAPALPRARTSGRG
jgi:hypothetical protein